MNSLKMNKRFLIISLATLFLWGCSHMPEYVEPTDGTMGLATIEGSTKFDIITLLRTTPIAIDNESIICNYSMHNIKPGSHHIVISYSHSNVSWFPFIKHYSVTIFAERNHRYIVRGEYWGKKALWVEDMYDPKIRWEVVVE